MDLCLITRCATFRWTINRKRENNSGAHAYPTKTFWWLFSIYHELASAQPKKSFNFSFAFGFWIPNAMTWINNNLTCNCNAIRLLEQKILIQKRKDEKIQVEIEAEMTIDVIIKWGEGEIPASISSPMAFRKFKLFIFDRGFQKTMWHVLILFFFCTFDKLFLCVLRRSSDGPSFRWTAVLVA